MATYREISNGDGTTSYVRVEEKQGDVITYEYAFSAFRRQYPHIKALDYRPADYLPMAIIVWVPGGAVLAQYMPSFDMCFILAQKQDQ